MAKVKYPSQSVSSIWPGAFGMNKSGRGIPAGCVSWQERAYDRNPKDIPVTPDVWEECKRKYER